MTQPWQRQRNEETDELEPMLWFSRFDKIYRPMGPERSLLGTVNQWRVQTGRKKYSAVPGAWNDAFDKWHWKPRAEAWDIAELERIRAEFKEDSDRWRANRFADANLIRDKALQYLAFPTSRRSGVDGDGISYSVEPLPASTFGNVVRALKAADELARITTRETLPKVEMDVMSDDEKLGADLGGLDAFMAYAHELAKSQSTQAGDDSDVGDAADSVDSDTGEADSSSVQSS